MNLYKLPENIKSNMGGENGILDGRLTQVFDLLESIDFGSNLTVLDIGMGSGQIAKWFYEKGHSVTGTGLFFDSYNLESELILNKKIRAIECSVENMPFNDHSFDVIIMSHVLEHCSNIGVALKEVRRVLSSNGILCIFLPPHDDFVCSGHISMGWNVGQLMYTLLVNGFEVKTGKFVQYGYNVAGVVQKNSLELPALRGDRGDIHILSKEGLWPIPVKSKDGLNDNFYGKIRSINWNIEKLEQKEYLNQTFINKLILKVIKITPSKMKYILSVKLMGLSRLFALSLNTTYLRSPN
jgi:SAM-dependent methyltransferase